MSFFSEVICQSIIAVSTRRLGKAKQSKRLWAYVREAAVRLSLMGVKTRAPVNGPVYIAGLLSSPSGIGRGARLMIDAMARQGVNVAKLDVGFVQGGHLSAHLAHGPGTLVVHLNPPDFLAALAGLGKAALKGKRIIGYWAWELEAVPAYWHKALPFADEVWAPSDFTAQAIRKAGFHSVRTIPHDLRGIVKRLNMREKFSLGDNLFIVGFVFSLKSNYARKNPDACIRVFLSAMKAAPNARLVLKVNDLEPGKKDSDDFLALIGQDPRIILIKDRLDDSEIIDLISCFDVYMSLHRSEGFGLTIIEAQSQGCAIIATNWSAPTEWLTSESALLIPYRLIPVDDPENVYSSSESWAEPEEKKAEEGLLELYRNPFFLNKMKEASIIVYRSSALKNSWSDRAHV